MPYEKIGEDERRFIEGNRGRRTPAGASEGRQCPSWSRSYLRCSSTRSTPLVRSRREAARRDWSRVLSVDTAGAEKSRSAPCAPHAGQGGAPAAVLRTRPSKTAPHLPQLKSNTGILRRLRQTPQKIGRQQLTQLLLLCAPRDSRSRMVLG